jgi:CHAT domain-containing protein
VLDDDSLLLEYALGDEHSYLWAVTRSTMHTYELPKSGEIERVARHLYELLVARQRRPGETDSQYQARVRQADTQYWPQAAALSQMLLAPVADQLGTKRLLIVAEGALQYVPFEGLPVPGKGDGTLGRRDAGKPPDGGTLRGGDLAVPLMVEHEIAYLPSASVLAVLRDETRNRRAASRAVAVIADPVFEADDPRVVVKPNAVTSRGGDKTIADSGTRRAGDTRKPPLRVATAPSRPVTVSPLSAEGFDLQPALRDGRTLRQGGLGFPRLLFSRDEAQAIMAVAPEGAAMKATGFKANRATATSPELGQYRIVHFATHGLLDSEHPERSGLVLSLVDEQGQRQDGFLGLHDIYNLNLPVDLVVLSACNTALGKEVRGEGLVGIVRGFMYAGAARVIASLWTVDDEATAELMKRFYQRMLQDGMRPAAALRAAQVDIWRQKRWSSPFYWAAFTLQGEWK